MLYIWKVVQDLATSVPFLTPARSWYDSWVLVVLSVVGLEDVVSIRFSTS